MVDVIFIGWVWLWVCDFTAIRRENKLLQKHKWNNRKAAFQLYLRLLKHVFVLETEHAKYEVCVSRRTWAKFFLIFKFIEIHIFCTRFVVWTLLYPPSPQYPSSWIYYMFIYSKYCITSSFCDKLSIKITDLPPKQSVFWSFCILRENLKL